MPLEDVPPGNYVARAMVRARGEVVAERTRQVQVLPGVAPAAGEEGADGHTWTPLEIIQGDLAKRYLAWIGERAKGTPAAGAAALAAANRWEQMELELQRAAKADGVAPHALQGLALFVREDYTAAAAALTLAGDAEPDSALHAVLPRLGA